MMHYVNNRRCLFITTLSILMMGCGGESSKTIEPQEQKVVSQSAEISEKNELHQPNSDTVDVVIATDPTNAPFEMTDEANRIIGLDVDIINAIAKDQNFTYRFKPTNWQGIFDNLDNNQADIISGIVVATDERRQKYDFTDPIFHKKRYAYLKKETAEKHNIKQFSDICSLKVAVKEQTDKAELYDTVCGADNPNRQNVISNYESFRKVANGSADAAIGDDIIFSYYIKDNGITDLVTFADPKDEELVLAWPVAKGNTEVLNKFNAGLNTIKANGEYDKIIQKWIDKPTH